MTFKSSKIWVTALMACGILAGAEVGRADTPIAWRQNTSGSWSYATNWSPADVPNGAYAVTLGSFDNAYYEVTLNS